MSWVRGPDGQLYWGQFGAAGVLAVKEGCVLLQQRSSTVQHGGTWSIPGGARDQGESAVDAALREAWEECGIDRDSLRIRWASVLHVGSWSYTTVAADVIAPVDLALNWETSRAEFVPIASVAELPLHPGFKTSWPKLERRLSR